MSTTPDKLAGLHLRGEELLFYRAAGRGELIYARCTLCGRPTVSPRWFCTSCGSEVMIDEVSNRLGIVESITTVHRGAPPAFRAPYQVAIVELSEGFRVMVGVVGAPCDIGDRVTIEFESQSEGLAVPIAQRGWPS